MNRPILLCAVFVAGLAIGGAASWLILDDGGVPRAPATAPGGLEPAPRPAVPAAAVPAGPSESRAAATPIRGRSFNEATRGGLEEYSAAAPVGTGTITGRVRTDKGEPLAGVVVRAEFQGDRDDGRQQWKTGDGPPPDLDMQTRVANFIEDSERSRAMRREAVTAANGEFTLDALLDDRYSLNAYVKGFAVNADQRDAQWNAKPGMNVDFTASPIIVVPIEVRLADGTVPKRAQVSINANNNNSAERWRPDRAEIRLGAGAYAISVTAGDREEWRSESQNVMLKEGVAQPPLSFKLTARTGIRGRVSVPKGYALDSLTIFGARYAGTAPPDEQTLKRGQQSWASPWNGFEFTFNDVAPGNWLVGAGTWESIFATKSVEVVSGKIAEVSIEITDGGATGLVVRVMAPGEAPVVDAQVSVQAPGNQWEPNTTYTVRPKKDGAWVISSKKDVADAREWLINVRSEKFGEKTVAMPATASGELRVDMADPASLEVTITGYASSGLEGRLRVDARPLVPGKESQPNRIWSQGEDPIGPDGKQTIKPLQPGRYRVQLQYQRERWGSNSALERVDVDVAPGSNAVSIGIPAVHSLVVVVGTDSQESNVNLSLMGTTEDRAAFARVGTDGTATFEGLVAGTYRVSVWNQKTRRNRQMKVAVPSGGPVTFKEDTETTLVVKVLDNDGYLAGAGLQVGDVIVGCDGATFDGSRPAMQVLSGLMMARKELKLSILRAGKALEAAVDSEKFGAATNHLRALEGGAR